MIKQDNLKSVIKIKNYIITLERIKNTSSGNPRYKAILINENNYSQNIEDGKAYKSSIAFSYTFTGHYWTEYSEAEYILKHHKDKYNIK